MLDLKTLNNEQKQAVTSSDGPLIVLAGAGTGKTRVITFRIGYLLEKGISPESIVALTFTNKAAKEMKERVGHLCGSATAKRLQISTFHSFCLKKLRLYHERLGLPANFSVMTPSDGIDFVRKSIEDLSSYNVINAYDVLGWISQVKNKLVTPEDLLQNPAAAAVAKLPPNIFQDLYQQYETRLKINQAIDFDDCILKFYVLLKSQPDVRQKIHEQIRYLLIDEFQDTNLAQLETIKQTVNAQNNICVVGDDDQSIYSFRGVVGNIFDDFEKSFPEFKIIKLEQNYRSSDIILKAAGKIIKNNTTRKSKTLWSSFSSETSITLSSHHSDVDEARHVAKKCLALFGKGQSPRDIAILYRTNPQAKALELALREAQIQYKVFGGSSLFERKEVRDFLAYLKVCLDPENRLALLRTINFPNRGVGIKTLEKAVAAATSKKLSLFEIFEHNLCDLSSHTKREVDSFCEAIREMEKRHIVAAEDLVALGEDIISRFKLVMAYKDMKISHEAKQRKIEILRGLPKWIGDCYNEIKSSKQKVNVYDLLDKLTTDFDGGGDKEKDAGSFVSLMTIHSAKGLEFKNVFLCGLEEEVLPHKNSLSTDREIEEERRLFYVAITRAKEFLHISHANTRSSYLRNIMKKPSRFLEELPKETIKWHIEHEQAPADPQLVKQTNLQRLGDLKSRLKAGFGSSSGT
ncbi:MAG: ATP-dependent helicase [Oligoflexales bacterium]